MADDLEGAPEAPLQEDLVQEYIKRKRTQYHLPPCKVDERYERWLGLF